MPGISSLLRSAAATRQKIQNQQDAQVAFEWDMSAQTYEDYIAYSKYLNEQSSKTTDPSSRLTYANKIKSAQRSFTSNEIQRSTQSVMEGTSSIADKKNIIQNLYDRAVNNGDMNLAQNLVSTWDGLDKQEQAQAEAAANAAERLQRAQDAYQNKTGAAYSSLAQSLKDGLESLTAAFNRSGQVGYNKAAKEFIDSHRDSLKAMGITLPKDISTNIGQVIEGTIHAIGQYYMLAGQATSLSSPEQSQNYFSKAQDIANGSTTFNTPAGQRNLYQVGELAKDPRAFVESTDSNGNVTLVASTKLGYRVNEYGNLEKIYSGMTQEQLSSKDNSKYQKQLEKLGFQNVRYDSKTGTFKVQLTNQSAQWLDPKSIDKSFNAEIDLEPTASGFQIYDRGRDKLFQIATDNRGLGALYAIDPIRGAVHVNGQYGFNQSTNSLMQNLSSVVAARKWVAPMLAPGQIDAKASGGAIPVFSQTTQQAIKQADPLGVMSFLNNRAGTPSMTQRAGGGFNFTDARGNAISAYTYAKQTGQSFRTVLSNMAAKGDAYAATALKYAGNDGAYNPAQVDLNTAKNWTSLTWGNNVNLQTPQAARVSGVSVPQINPSLNSLLGIR